MIKNAIVRRIFKQVSRASATLLFVCIVFALVSMLVPAQQLLAAGNTYYVATDGNDSDPGTEAEPWKTLNKAGTTATAGDTVYFRGGTWTAEKLSPSHSGSIGNIITYKNYPGETPIFNGTGFAASWGNSPITLTGNKSYITFEGITVRDVYESGMGKHGAGIAIWPGGGNTISHVTVKDCTIINTESSGVYCYAVGATMSYITIDGVECDTVNQGGGGSEENISLSNVQYAEVKNCYIHDSFQEGIDLKSGCNNCIVHHNEIADTPSAGLYADGYNAAQSGNEFYNNIIYDGHHAIVMGCETTAHAQQANFYNNMIYNCDVGFITYYPAFPLPVMTFNVINNTFYNCDHAIVLLHPSANYSNCVIRNNILYEENAKKPLITYSGYPTNVTVDNNQTIISFSPVRLLIMAAPYTVLIILMTKIRS